MNDTRYAVSVLQGTLVRIATNQWAWSDGTPEPRVRDISPSSHFNFRCRTYGDGITLVEVPLGAAHRDRPLLGWVLDGVARGRYQQSTSGDHTGPLLITDEGTARMRIEPGEDPLLGHEPIMHTRAIPRVALVPVTEWDAWARETPYGAQWDLDQQQDILARARALGWQG